MFSAIQRRLSLSPAALGDRALIVADHHVLGPGQQQQPQHRGARRARACQIPAILTVFIGLPTTRSALVSAASTTIAVNPGDLSGRQVAAPEEFHERQPELIPGEPVVRVDPEVGDQPVAVEDPDDDVGVPDVDREQHRGECRHHRPVIALLDIGGTKIAASAGRDAAIGTVRRIPTAGRLRRSRRCAA